MTKKEYLIKLLTKIWDNILPIAPDLLYIIKNKSVDDSIIESLYTIFNKAIKTTEDISKKIKLEKWLSVLDKIKTLEKNQNISDQKDIKDIEELLKNI